MLDDYVDGIEPEVDNDVEIEPNIVKLHRGQSQIFKDQFVDRFHRYIVLCCSRGFGKSFLGAAMSVAAVNELLQLPHWVPNKNVGILAPTFDQVTDIYYDVLAQVMGLEALAKSASKDRGKFVFHNGTELHLLSYEAVSRARGKGYYFFLWDEVASCKKNPKDAWESVIQPTVGTRWSPKRARLLSEKLGRHVHHGRAAFLSTPDGFDYFKELFDKQDGDEDWKSFHFNYKQSPLLDISDIERIKHDIDPVKFASEYDASFKESSNNVFYCFDRSRNVERVPDFTDEEVIYASIDFNVAKQCTGYFALRGNRMEYIDESSGHADTEQLAISIKTKFPNRKVVAFPDPSGKSKKTSAVVGRTDFTILKSYDIEVCAKSSAPQITASVNAVNRKLHSAAGDVTMVFHPRCKGLINSMERTRWLDNNKDTATIDKSQDIEHFSDGVRYATDFLFPIMGKPTAKRGFGF